MKPSGRQLPVLGLALLGCVPGSLAACKGGPKPMADDGSNEHAAAPEQPEDDGESGESGDVEAAAGLTPPKLDEAMKGHFDRVSHIKDAVIDGDFDGVAEPAKWLADELPVAGLPKTWQPHATAMQTAAAKAGEADDLLAAGELAGDLVSACGACHAAVGNGPEFGALTPVPEGETTTARMQRHQWAADRMWEAMVSRSEARWKAGAGAVSEAPPEPCPIPDEHVLPREALDLREKIYELGARADEADTWDARADIYGEYLTTCADCHVGGC